MAEISSLFTALCVVIFIHLFLFHPVVEGFESFSVDLIHRDSPKSPYYNSSISHYERLNNAVHRSFLRAARFTGRTLHAKLDRSGFPEIESDIISGKGEYLMKLSVGTPPVEVTAIADTGSDLTWIQCQPCLHCYKQNDRIFNPRKSRTYKKLSCISSYCLGYGMDCDKNNTNCRYEYFYGDGSSTVGDVALETYTFLPSNGKNVSIPNIVLGCGNDQGGSYPQEASGIIGLGAGEVSLVKQLGQAANGKFSYCLVPIDSDSSSTIKFGKNAEDIDSDDDSVSTPLIIKYPDTYYYLTLEGISVGNKKISAKDFSGCTTNATSSESFGNIIIDSGTTLTMLPSGIYYGLVKLLNETINGTVTADPEGFYGLCYKMKDNVKFPDLVVHFDGADVVLPGINTFWQVNDDLICFTMVPADDDAFSIYGNLAQMNFVVEYDLLHMRVSFKPTDCTNNH